MKAIVLVLAVLAPAAATAQEQTRSVPRKYLYDGRWMTKYEIERSRYVRVDGEWRLRADVERERLAAKLAPRIRSDLRLLASSYSKTRDAAKRRLLDAAARLERPALAKTARGRHAAYDSYWRAVRAAEHATVTLGIDAQLSRVQGIDTVPVSFGTGSGRLQLPRTRSVSIGTTVTVPAGVR